MDVSNTMTVMAIWTMKMMIISSFKQPAQKDLTMMTLKKSATAHSPIVSYNNPVSVLQSIYYIIYVVVYYLTEL